MANRTVSNPERGCGHLKRGKAYIRGMQTGEDGILPTFVRAVPPIPFREMGTNGEFTRGYKEFDGLTAQLALERNGMPEADDLSTTVGMAAATGETDGLAEFVPMYGGIGTHKMAIENMVKHGFYRDASEVPELESQRHIERIRMRGAEGEIHWGSVPSTRQADLLMRAGKSHYPEPEDFIEEAAELGISKAVPLSQNRDPPEVVSGVTRTWIVHPDTEDGWAIIGYAYLNEIIFTEPADGKVPEYVKNLEESGKLEVVDIEDPEPDDPDLDDYEEEEEDDG